MPYWSQVIEEMVEDDKRPCLRISMKRSWGLRGSTGNIIALGKLYEVLSGKSGARLHHK